MKEEITIYIDNEPIKAIVQSEYYGIMAYLSAIVIIWATAFVCCQVTAWLIKWNSTLSELVVVIAMIIAIGLNIDCLSVQHRSTIVLKDAKLKVLDKK